MEGEQLYLSGLKPLPGIGNKTKKEALYLQKEKDESTDQPKKIRKNPKKKTDLELRLDTGLVSEKGLGFSLYKASLELNEDILKVDRKVWWIGDCIAWKIESTEGISFTDELRKEILSVLTPDNLAIAEKELAEHKENNPKLYNKIVPTTILTSAEIRSKTGKKDLLNSQIHELVKQFFGVVIERETQRNIDGDKYTVKFQFDNICEVDGEYSGKFSSRGQQPEYKYTFTFDKASSLDFWLSMVTNYFTLRPHSYYKLKAGSELIMRALGWTQKPSDIELDVLCRIAQVKTKDKRWKQIAIKRYLDELKKKGFIADWKPKPKKIEGLREKQVWYRIWKVSNLPVK